MRVLVVGGTRFVGPAVVRRLRARGHDVAVLNRRRAPAVLPEDVVRIQGDRDDLPASRGAIDRFAPDVVVHDVLYTRGQAEHAVDFFRGIVSRFVMLSSMDVYRAYGRLVGSEPGPVEPMPITESSPLRERHYPLRRQAKDSEDFRWSYDKIPAEQVATGDPDLPATVLRLPMILGRGDYQHRLFSLVRPMTDGRPAIVLQRDFAHWQSTFAYVENVGEAVARACADERAAGRVYNVADASPTWLELGGLVAGVLGWRGEFVLLPASDLPAPLVVAMRWEQSLVARADRIGEELGYRPVVDFEDGLGKAVLWERANPPDPLPVERLAYEAQDEVLRRSA